MRKTAALVMMVAVSLSLSACRSPEGATPDEKRAHVQKVKNETLERLYREKPETKEKIAKAAGYGTFSNIGMKIFLLASGNGFGVLHENGNGKEHYMRMRELGVGIGLGVKDFRCVMVFKTPAAINKFVTEGWQWAGDADASAETGGSGASLGVQADVMVNEIEVYVFTENGIALMAAVTGTKYWKDEEPN